MIEATWAWLRGACQGVILAGTCYVLVLAEAVAVRV